MLVSASAAAGTALVKLATPSEALALTNGQSAVLGQPSRYEMPWMGTEIYMKAPLARDEETGIVMNRYVPVGYLTQLDVHTEMADASSWWEGHGTLIPGIKHWTFEFEGRS